MLEILQNMISVLTGDATLISLVPATNILVGPVDIVTEAQLGLILPQVNLQTVSEVSRSVPSNTRDTDIQIDIWSRVSQLEIENIYERIITLLNYTSPVQGSAKIFWERLGGAVDQYEGDRRIWHRAMTYRVWAIKP
jgi:hypothetical protein